MSSADEKQKQNQLSDRSLSQFLCTVYFQGLNENHTITESEILYRKQLLIQVLL